MFKLRQHVRVIVLWWNWRQATSVKKPLHSNSMARKTAFRLCNRHRNRHHGITRPSLNVVGKTTEKRWLEWSCKSLHYSPIFTWWMTIDDLMSWSPVVSPRHYNHTCHLLPALLPASCSSSWEHWGRQRRQLVPSPAAYLHGSSSLTHSAIFWTRQERRTQKLHTKAVVINSWFQMVGGLNRLLTKKIRSIQRQISEESRQTGFKTSFVPP